MTVIQTAVSVLFVGVMALATSESTKAALIDRGNGLIYDNVLNITWIQDVALSSTLGGSGIFNWYDAKAWADQLVYRGYDDWRLPTLTPVNGVNFNADFPLRWLGRLRIRHSCPWRRFCRIYRQRTCVHVSRQSWEPVTMHGTGTIFGW